MVYVFSVFTVIGTATTATTATTTAAATAAATTATAIRVDVDLVKAVGVVSVRDSRTHKKRRS